MRHYRLDTAVLWPTVSPGWTASSRGSSERSTQIPMLQAGGLFPPRIAADVRMPGRLGELGPAAGGARGAAVRGARRPSGAKASCIMRCFGEEKALYYEMFSKGHLSEGAYRSLVHSVDDAVGRDPTTTGTSPTSRCTHRAVSGSVAPSFGPSRSWPGLSGLVERAFGRNSIERDYEVAWARYHGDQRVLRDLHQLLGDRVPPQPTRSKRSGPSISTGRRVPGVGWTRRPSSFRNSYRFGPRSSRRPPRTPSPRPRPSRRRPTRARSPRVSPR